MNFTYASSKRLPLKEFRSLAQEHFRGTQVARAGVYQNYTMFVNEWMYHSFECYDGMIRSILLLKDNIQHFSSLFHNTSSLPQSIYAIRHSLIKALRCIDRQVDDLIFQILILKDVSAISSNRIIKQQQMLQHNLEKLLQDSNDALGDMHAFIDKVSFLENRYGS